MRDNHKEEIIPNNNLFNHIISYYSSCSINTKYKHRKKYKHYPLTKSKW